MEIQKIKDKILRGAKGKDGLPAKDNYTKNTIHRIQCPTKLLFKEKNEIDKLQR